MVLFVIITVLVALLIPAALYGGALPQEHVWGLVPDGKTLVGHGAYRETMRTAWVRGRAPIVVRIAAYMCFLLGQMIVPGAFAALVGFLAVPGMLFSGGGGMLGTLFLWLSAPTGLIVAWRLVGSGRMLLRREPLAVEAARKAAAWEIRHNVVLVAVLSLAAFFGPHENGVALLLVIGPAVGAIAHGVLLLRAAAALERYDASQHEERALPPEAPQDVLAEAF